MRCAVPKDWKREYLTCWKHGCHNKVVTFEIDDKEGFPNGLCEECARKPTQPGTFENPTWVGT